MDFTYYSLYKTNLPYATIMTEINNCNPNDTAIFTQITYTAANLTYTTDSSGHSYADLDLLATDTPQNLLFSEGQIYVVYDTTIFGSDMVSRGAITATRGTIDSFYSLSLSDSAPNILKLTLVHDSTNNLTNLDSVNTNAQLCHLRVNISSFNITAVAAYWDTLVMQGASLYKSTPNGVALPYDKVLVSGLVGAPQDGGDTLIYSLENVSLNSSTTPTQLDFDVAGDATNTDPGNDPELNPITDYTVVISCNPNAFSSATITNSLGSGDNEGNAIYDFTSSFSSGIITITLMSNTYFDGTDPNEDETFYYMQDPPIGLAHVTLTISNCNDTPGVAIIASSSSAEYATAADRYSDAGYSPVIAGNGFNNNGMPMCPPACTGITITGFSPEYITAGTFDTLTITGCGFGGSPGAVLFTNANDITGQSTMQTQPSDIIYWGDSLVRLIVASCEIGFNDGHTPGTGPIQIQTYSGDTSNHSTQPLGIPYAVMNNRLVPSYRAVRLGLSGAGTDYTFTPDTTITGHPHTLATITHAMNDWVCETGVRFTMGTPVSTNLTSDSDGINAIYFGSLPDSNDNAETSVYPSAPCVNPSGDTVEVIMEEDYCYNMLLLDSNMEAPFFIGDTSVIPPAYASRISLLFAARHEFGHGSGLFHVLNFDDLMYPEEDTDVCKLIRYDDREGGLYELVTAGGYLSPCFTANPQSTLPLNCSGGTNGIVDIGNGYGIKAWPNPFDQTITIQADISSPSDVKIELFDVLGQEVTSDNYRMVSNGQFQNTISTAGLSIGIYLLRVSVNKSAQVFKLIKTNY